MKVLLLGVGTVGEAIARLSAGRPWLETMVLADHDVALVRQLLQQASSRSNYEVLNQIANKVKTLTGIQTDLQDEPFLKTVLRDYAHLAQQE